MRGHKSFFLKKVYFFALSPTENFVFLYIFQIKKGFLIFPCFRLPKNFFVLSYLYY